MKPLAALAFAALLLASCKKDDLDPDGLVPATQAGKNTSDFLLNGQPWGPKASVTSTGRAVGAIWHKIRGGRQITVILGRRYKNDDTGVNIVLPHIVGPAVFTITDGVSPVIIAGDRSYIRLVAKANGLCRQWRLFATGCQSTYS